MTVCAIKPCRNYKGRLKTPKHVTYHRIPNNPTNRYRWINRIRKSRGDATWKPTNSTLVCSDHFRSKDMYTVNKTGRRRLTKEAVPSKALFLSSVKSSESEDSDNNEIAEIVCIEPKDERVGSPLDDVDFSDNDSILDPPKEFHLKRKLKAEILKKLRYRSQLTNEKKKTRRLKSRILILREIIRKLKIKKYITKKQKTNR